MEHFRKSRAEKPRQELSEITDPTMHDSNLHDHDEDKSGERIDHATGKKIDNSTETGLERLQEFDPERKSDDEPDDAAARWLRENDPN